MAIRVETSFLVPAAIDAAWTILTDLPRMAPCLPGAAITEAVDATTYKGTATVKLGPVQLLFKGEARMHDLDRDAHRARLSVRGADTRGRGNVQSTMAFQLSPEGDQTRVEIATDITLSGAVAQYGRGVGLIKEICNQYTAQFAQNLARRIEAGEETPGTEVAPASAIGLVAGAVRAMVTRKGDVDGV